MVGNGCPGHGPIHLLSAGAAEIGFRWDPHALAFGLGLVCLYLAIWLALFSFLRLLFLMLGVIRLLLISVGGKGFGGGPLLDVHGSLQLLVSSHVRERDKALLRTIMVGGVWNGSSSWSGSESGCSLSVLWCS